MQLKDKASLFIRDNDGGPDITGRWIEGTLSSIGVSIAQIEVVTDGGPFHISLPKAWLKLEYEAWTADVRIKDAD